MDLYPAIDILEGSAVRLRQGDFEQKSVYADDPVAAARRWVEEGARRLHVVDLDGAKAGSPASVDHLRRICADVPVKVQYGGGLRSLDHLEEALDAGAETVVLGTAAFTDAGLLEGAIERWGDRVAVAVDVRANRVSTAGWTEQSQLRGGEAVTALRERGARAFIYTNVDRDGMMIGLDLAEVTRISELVGDGRFLYSGGIGSLDDLRGLSGLGLGNLTGVIVGKALYENRFGVQEAQSLLEDAEATRSS